MKKTAIIGAIIGLIVAVIVNCMPRTYEVTLEVPARDEYSNITTWETADITSWDDVYEQFGINN